jgi:hypothetical protein
MLFIQAVLTGKEEGRPKTSGQNYTLHYLINQNVIEEHFRFGGFTCANAICREDERT